MSSIPDCKLFELTTKVDLSDVIADIDTLCFRLDFYAMGQWWDYKRSRRKLSHPAVAAWMANYGFKGFEDLPIGAVVAMRDSLQRHLSLLDKGLNPGELPTSDGGQP